VASGVPWSHLVLMGVGTTGYGPVADALNLGAAQVPGACVDRTVVGVTFGAWVHGCGTVAVPVPFIELGSQRGRGLPKTRGRGCGGAVECKWKEKRIYDPICGGTPWAW